MHSKKREKVTHQIVKPYFDAQYRTISIVVSSLLNELTVKIMQELRKVFL